ncbi:MAG TPA: class I SAM-dependent methyltransferase [Spirochaetales bacterium]|nr:methyltransferase domain-containing protein [Spirochaetia bacterium]HPE36235.1 class I SAM-dependent methyltransferase [Spirochaetales bacterium]
MPKTKAFDEYRDRYEAWFERYKAVYESELKAIRQLLPAGRGLEVGVGTGLFASALGISDGVEPSAVMAELALARCVHVCRGRAEKLPYHSGTFDYGLMVTTICFVDNPRRAIRELGRVVRSGGEVVMAFVDKASPLGQVYLKFKKNDVFYRKAVFYSVAEVTAILERGGFLIQDARQTVFGQLDDIKEIQEPRPGTGTGGFVVLRAQKR